MCDHANNPGGREAAMVTVARDDEGKPTVWCDPCIEPLVAALNYGDHPTDWSCCGHGRRPATIGLKDGRQILVLPSMTALHAIEGMWPGINDEPASAPSLASRVAALADEYDAMGNTHAQGRDVAADLRSLSTDGGA